MGYIYQYEKYKDGVSKEDSYPGYDYYFHPDILWDIYRDSYLDKGEIYRCLTKDVTDVPKLRNKMTALYPDKAVDLEFIFARYGMRPRLQNTSTSAETAGQTLPRHA